MLTRDPRERHRNDEQEDEKGSEHGHDCAAEYQYRGAADEQHQQRVGAENDACRLEVREIEERETDGLSIQGARGIPRQAGGPMQCQAETCHGCRNRQEDNDDGREVPLDSTGGLCQRKYMCTCVHFTGECGDSHEHPEQQR